MDIKHTYAGGTFSVKHEGEGGDGGAAMAEEWG